MTMQASHDYTEDTATAIRERGEVERAATELAMSVDEAHKSVMDLRERIAPVLRPDGPDRMMEGSTAPHSVCSPLADQLGTTLDALQSLSRQVRDLTSRVDL